MPSYPIIRKNCINSVRNKLDAKGRLGFPDGSASKESACNAGDLGSMPGSGRSPEEGSGWPLQYSCLENSRDRGNRQGLQRWNTTEWLTTFTFKGMLYHEILNLNISYFVGFSGGSVVKNLPASAEDVGSIPDPGRSHRAAKPVHHGCRACAL